VTWSQAQSTTIWISRPPGPTRPDRRHTSRSDGRSQSDAWRRLNRVVHDADQLATQHVEVDLLAQPAGERPHRGFGVVRTAREPVVDRVLDAAAKRLEADGHDQRGERHGQGAGCARR